MRQAGKRRWKMALAWGMLAALLLLPLGGCKNEVLTGMSFRFPLSAEPRQIDPQVSVDTASVTLCAALFEGLTRLNEDGQAVPGMADWTVSADGLVYTFVLRESAWSDGTPVTAQNFVFGMQRAVAPDTGSALASRLFDIRNAQAINEGKLEASQLGVTADNARTLHITLVQANNVFPERLAETPFFPCNRAFFEETGGRYGLEQEYILTNGAFSLAGWNHGEQLRLVKNEYYHAADEVAPATVRYVIGTASDPVATLKAGGLDAAELPADRLDEARSDKLQLVTLRDTVSYVWLNTQIKPLSSAPVRRALRDAIDWDGLNARLDSTYAGPAEGYVAPDAVIHGTQTYRTAENARRAALQETRARQALEAGLTALELKSCPKLTVLCADDAYSKELALYVLQSWQKYLLVYFDLTPLPADALEARVNVGNYDIALASTTVSGFTALDAFGSFCGDATRGNLARYTDTAYNAKYRRAAAGTPERKTLEALEAALWEACPAIPLCFETRTYGLPEKVTGVRVRPFGGGVFGAPLDFRNAQKPEE